MTELDQICAEVGISQYLEAFIEHGFDTWDAIQDITESDLDFLAVKLGHRRKLQRRIAKSRGLSQGLALGFPSQNTPPEERPLDEQKGNAVEAEEKDTGIVSGPQGAKRKYRRHPRPDENAPDRPPSAYVIFSNRVREDLRGRNMSFTEIAKRVGENWQGLLAAQKEPYEQQAVAAKERYNTELAAYKKTRNFAEYSQYLAEFKTRLSNQQQVTALDVPKRPKLEKHSNAERSTAASSSVSQQCRDSPPAHMSAEPSPAGTNQWSPMESHHLTTLALPAVQPGNRRSSPSSPSNMSSGYRETILVGNTQSLPWREGDREQRTMPLEQRCRVASISDRPARYSGSFMEDTFNSTDTLQHGHRMGPISHLPLTSASISSSMTSTSAYLIPRSPLESSLQRSLSISYPFSHQFPGSYENQLPPIQASLSPRSRDQGLQQPPSSMLDGSNLYYMQLTDSSPGNQARGEYPASMAPLNGHPRRNPPQSGSADNDPRPHKFDFANDSNLDPVSALLRAGEIVNLTSRGTHPN